MSRPKKGSQSEAVLEYLETHVGLSSKVASDELGITRLSSRIYDLIHKYDQDITFVWKESPIKRYMRQSRYKEYRLVKSAS